MTDTDPGHCPTPDEAERESGRHPVNVATS